MRKFFASFFMGCSTLLLSTLAFAQEAGASGGSASSAGAIAAGLAMGIAVLGGTLSQGKAATAALEGVARNPGAASKIQTPMILGLALIESLVLLAFVMGLFLLGKI